MKKICSILLVAVLILSALPAMTLSAAVTDISAYLYAYGTGCETWDDITANRPITEFVVGYRNDPVRIGDLFSSMGYAPRVYDSVTGVLTPASFSKGKMVVTITDLTGKVTTIDNYCPETTYGWTSIDYGELVIFRIDTCDKGLLVQKNNVYTVKMDFYLGGTLTVTGTVSGLAFSEGSSEVGRHIYQNGAIKDTYLDTSSIYPVTGVAFGRYFGTNEYGYMNADWETAGGWTNALILMFPNDALLSSADLAIGSKAKIDLGNGTTLNATLNSTYPFADSTLIRLECDRVPAAGVLYHATIRLYDTAGIVLHYEGSCDISAGGVAYQEEEDPETYYIDAGDYGWIDEPAWFVFTPSYSGEYTFYSDSDVDPRCYLYDGDSMDLLASDDDGGDGVNFNLSYYLVAGETYYYYVDFYSESGYTYWELFEEEPEDEYFTLQSGGSYLTYGGKAKFTPPIDGTYRLESDYPEGDPVCRLYDENFNLLATDDDGGDGYNFCLEYDLVGWNVYYYDISFYGDSAYTEFTLTLNTPSYPKLSLNTQYSVNGEKWFLFVPATDGDYRFVSGSATGDPYVKIYDADGNYYGYFDDSEGSLNFDGTVTCYAGETYIVCASDYDGGSYNLKVTKVPELEWSYANGVLTIFPGARMKEYSDIVLPPWHDYADSITSIVIKDGVPNLGRYAFYECSKVTGITIPASVTEISEEAFYRCDGLKKFTVASNNPSYSSADGVLFNKNKTVLLSYPDAKSGDYTVPAGVTRIGNSAFDDCLELTAVSLPGSLEVIEDFAFWRCEGLRSVTIPASVNRMGEGAFEYCLDLEEVVFEKKKQQPEGGYTFTDLNGNGYIKTSYANIPGTEVSADPYSTSTPWENWNGYFQMLWQMYKPEIDATDSCWDPDSWKWTVLLSPVDTDGIYRIGQCQVDTVYDWGSDDGKVIYRIQTGNLTENLAVGTECEVIVIARNGSRTYKSRMFLIWTEESQQQRIYWEQGKNYSGEYDDDHETHVPTSGCADINYTGQSTSAGMLFVDGFCFSGDGSLTKVYVPKEAVLCEWVFSNCYNLADIYCEAASQPDSWDPEWKELCDATVHWGAENPYSALPGDVNLDGTLSIGDVSALLVILAQPAYSDSDYAIADLNEDGTLSIGDVSALLMILANQK